MEFREKRAFWVLLGSEVKTAGKREVK